MDALVTSSLFRLVRDVSLFGGELSSILQSYASLCDSPVNQDLKNILLNLDSANHTLNQLSKLLSPTRAAGQQDNLFNDEGLKYVEVLTEECSVVFERVRLIFASERTVESCTYEYWKSPIGTDSEGHRVFQIPILDEAQIFRKIKATGRRLFQKLWDPADRLGHLQTLLLLVIQVVTVQDLTTKLPSGKADLKSIVEYHDRIGRAAKKACLTTRHGRVVSESKWRRSRSYSPSSSGSESDYRRRSRSRPRPLDRRGSPPPRPNLSRSPPQPPPKPFNVPPTPPRGTEAVILPPPPAPGLTEPRVIEAIGSENVPKDVHPPTYSEKEGGNGLSSDSKESANKSLEDVKFRGTETELPRGGEKSLEASGPNRRPIVPSVDDGRLLKSKVGLRMKLKGFLRSKSSLEAEMKRTLADSNASLTAFMIHNKLQREIPHSAFHSLEYTHMRAILSQLHDNTWFKVYSVLTDTEHDTLTDLLEKRFRDGKYFKRELVVLKILHQNRLNDWMNVLQDRMGVEGFLTHHENYRMILAIFREKECEADDMEKTKINSLSPLIGDEHYDSVPKPLAPEPLIARNGPQIHDLSMPPAHPPAPYFPRGPPPINFYPPPPPPPGFKSPSGPNVSTFPPRNAPPPPRWPPADMPRLHVEVTPRNPVSEASAIEALTFYTAYTIRPVTPQTPLQSETWARCFLTRDNEETSVLLSRITQFRDRGDSIIDVKLQLTEPQAAQISRLENELNSLELDQRFEHRIVELSMVDRGVGLVRRQTKDKTCDVLHIITSRTLKEAVNPLVAYDTIMRPRLAPPPPPPPPQPHRIIVERCKKSKWPRRARSFSSSAYDSSGSGSDSESDSETDSSNSSGSRSTWTIERRRARKGNGKDKCRKGKGKQSDSEDKDVNRRRFKSDPAAVKFQKKERGMDVVDALLQRWTPWHHADATAGEKSTREGSPDTELQCKS